ncbi:MAG TPA: methyltransferase domain-containing protein, partial [Solirubrobacteraceae bacterium]|nr:methyltransferase domain-containing protein [Solirubrobacteraceae bacterium]
MDAESYRADSRDRWERVADGWRAARPAMQQAAQAVSDWMIRAIDPKPGQTVLELAAGPADTGLMAARLVAPDGKAIITDSAEAMVAVAAARAGELGIENVEVRAMEAEWIDLPAASVDAVLCRWGYMIVADQEAALRETRRVLRPGGRAALAAWDAPEHNPWMALGRRVTIERGLVPPEEPGMPGPFSFAEPGRIEELLEATGFDDIVVEAVDFTFDAPSLDAWWEQTVRTSPTMEEMVSGLSPADHYAFRDAFDAAYAEFVASDGSVSLPARTLVA